MAKHHITGNTSQPFHVTGSGDTWIVDKTASITTAQDFHEAAISDDLNSHDSRIVINGHITGSPEGDDYGVLLQGRNASVEIGQSGEVNGYIAIYATGRHQSVINHGDILSDGYAVFSEHRITVDNSGNIIAGSGIHTTSGGGDITNEAGAKIIVQDAAVRLATLEGDVSTFVNRGYIEAGYYVIDSGFGDETVINRGVMKGTISLKAGDDTFDNRGGSVDHDISSDEGNDTLITDDSAVKLVEADGGGTDTVKSTVSYTLNDYVENLLLIGKANSDGIGNTMKNRLDGNAGSNHLSGDAGKDHLDGHKSNDIMTGGAGGDTFVFAKDYGHDTISDFEKGVDRIDLRGWDDVTSFSDLKAHHLHEVGNNLVIQAGDDRLTLKSVDITDLHASDLIF
jgi:Ca2+-binding RTX toxin-like protein